MTGVLLVPVVAALAACEDVRLPSVRTAPPLLEAPWLPTRTLPLAAVIGVSDAPTRTTTPTPNPRLDALGIQLGVVASLQSGTTGHPVTDLAFSPTGSLLAAAASSEPVRLWDVATGRLIQEFALSAEAVAFSADGRLLAIASDTRVRVYRPEGNAEVRVPRGEGGPPQLDLTAPSRVDHVAFTEDGRLVAAGQSQMVIWDLESGEVVGEAELGAATGSMLSMDGELLVTYVYPGRVDVRETTQGFFLRSISIGTSEYTGNMLAISTDLTELVTYAAASRRPEVHFWSLENGEEIRVLALGLENPVGAYAAEENLLALSRGSGAVVVSPLVNLVVGETAGRGGAVTAIAVSPGGETVAGGTASGLISLWGAIPPRVPTPVPTATSMEPPVSAVNVGAPPSLRVALSQDLRVPGGLNVPNIGVLDRLHVPEGGRFRAFPDSRRGVVTTALRAPLPGIEIVGDPTCDGPVRLQQVLNLSDATVTATFQVLGDQIVWDSTGERLVSVCRRDEGASFHVLDATGRLVTRLEVDRDSYDGGPIQVSDNAEMLAFQPAVGPGPSLAVWPTTGAREVLRLEGGRGFWLAPAGTAVYGLLGHAGEIYVTVQSGQRFLYTSLQGRADILRVDVPSGAPTWSISPYTWAGPPGYLGFGDDDLVVFGPVVGLWYLDENRVFDPSFGESVASAAVSPDGRLVVFASWSGDAVRLHFFERDGRFRITIPVSDVSGQGFGFCLEGRALWVGTEDTAFLGVPE
jgi:WD40 repeat protein